MRKRKLYVSELLEKTADKTIALHIRTIYKEFYFDTIEQAIKRLNKQGLWNLQVELWLVDKWKPKNGKYIKTLYIRTSE